MKKILFIAAAAVLTACGSKTGQRTGADGTQVATDSITNQEELVDEAGRQYLEQFYDSLSHADYIEYEKIIRRNVTQRAIKTLEEQYDYDVEGIATWMFTQDPGEDVGPAKHIDIKRTAPNTYRVTCAYKEIGGTYYYRITIGLAKVGNSYKIDNLSDWKGETVWDANSPETALPETAQRVDITKLYELYINEEQASANEGDTPAIYSVWLVDRQNRDAQRLFVTNPFAEAQWERMKGENPDAVSVSMDQIASAERGWIIEEDASKIVVEGCPDARNEWTYLIDVPTMTAKQLPGASGFKGYDQGTRTIAIETYGYYEEGGRYEYRRILTYEGKFVERTDAVEM